MRDRIRPSIDAIAEFKVQTNVTNFASSPIKTQNGTTFDARIDHRLTPNTNVFGRYSFNDVTTFVPTGFPDVNGINPGGNFGGAFPGPNKTRAQNLQMNLIRVRGSNLLLEVKIGYLRAAIQTLPVNTGRDAANQLGFACNAANCVNNGDIQTFGLPQMNIQGFQGLGDPVFIPLLQFDNTFQYTGALDYTWGAHNGKGGAGLIRRQFTIIQSVSARGAFTFNASTPNAPAPANNGLASRRPNERVEPDIGVAWHR